MTRQQQFRTRVLEPDDVRTISVSCPYCDLVNDNIVVGTDDATGAIECWHCSTVFEYKEYYKEMPDDS